MLVTPYIYDSDGTKNYLAPRELRKTKDNFGIVRYKRKLFFVRNDYLILLDHEAPDQAVSYFTRVISDEFKFKESIIQDHSVRLIIPDAKGLYELAMMGVDMAVIFLRVKARSHEKTLPIYRRALRLKTRYKKLEQITFSEASTLYEHYLTLDPLIEHAKNKFLVYPFNNRRFVLEMKQVNEFRVNDYLSQEFKTIGFQPSTPKKTIEKHLIKNIFFHNSMVSEKEFGGLNLRPHYPNSKELQRYIARWRNSTKNNLRNLAHEVIKRTKTDPKLAAIYEQEIIERDALDLSIFMLLTFSEDPQVKNRIHKLFDLGVKKVGHLVNLP